LALRSGQYQIINVTEIYQGEEIKQDRLTGKIVLNGRRNGNDVIGYCAYFKLLNGFEKYLYMTSEEVTDHAKKFSKSYDNDKSIWKINFDAMAKKTVLKALISKYGVMSIQMQNAITQEEHEAQEESRELGEVIDATAREMPREPEAFDPVAVVLDGGYAENEYAAKGMVNNYMPEEIKTNREAVLTWAKIYRGWRDANPKMSKDECKAKADAGELPQ
jgi:recombination protein RecT